MVPFRKGVSVLFDEGIISFIRKTVRYLTAKPDDRWTRLFDIEKGDTVVDIGANVGEFTNIAADRAGEEGTVLAVEPEPDNVKGLRQRFGDRQNVELVEVAIMDYNGRGELHLNPVDSDGHSMIQSVVGAGHRARGEDVQATDSVVVDVMTLDKLCCEEGVEGVDFLKIDIEGGEVAALRGGERTLKVTDKIVVEANHPKDGEEMDGEKTYPIVECVLSRHGFATHTTNDEWVFGVK